MTPTPAALAMRRYRARVREANPPGLAVHIYEVVRPGRSRMWEGRVQRNGKRHVIARSWAKYGAHGAYLMVRDQVARWLKGEE
jgi:hypothetical protein